MPVEREVKLAAWAGMALPDLDGVAPGVTAVALTPQRLTATYYDTSDLRLARWGVTVRYRAGDSSEEPTPWTVKLPSGGGAPRGGLARDEIGFVGPEGRVPAAVSHLVRGLTRSAPLTPVARLRTDRLRIEVRGADGLPAAELDDDEVSVLVGRRLASRFREIEVELAPGVDALILDAVVARLRSAGAGAADPTPKAVRALGPRALEAPDVVVEQIDGSVTVARAVRAAIAASVVRLLRHDPGVRLGHDAEDVHQARVATRRMRSDLRTFRSLVDETWSADLRQELGWVAALLGDVRDTDVLLERLGNHCAGLPQVDAKGANVLLRRLEDHRDVARRALLTAMDSDRYVALLDRLVVAAAAPVFRAEGGPAAAGVLGRPASEVMPDLVRPPWRHLRQAVEELGPHPADVALHDVRIRAKRCRYAAEATAPVVGKRAAQFAEAVAGLQGVLGEFHDAIVAEEWLRQAVAKGPPAVAVAAGQLIAAERADAAAGRTGWKAAWKAASGKKLRNWFE